MLFYVYILQHETAVFEYVYSLEKKHLYRIHYKYGGLIIHSKKVPLMFGEIRSFEHSINGNPDSKVHVAHMGHTWVLSAPCGPHVGPKNLAIRVHIFYRFPASIAFASPSSALRMALSRSSSQHQRTQHEPLLGFDLSTVLNSTAAHTIPVAAMRTIPRANNAITTFRAPFNLSSRNESPRSTLHVKKIRTAIPNMCHTRRQHGPSTRVESTDTPSSASSSTSTDSKSALVI